MRNCESQGENEQYAEFRVTGRERAVCNLLDWTYYAEEKSDLAGNPRPETFKSNMER